MIKPNLNDALNELEGISNDLSLFSTLFDPSIQDKLGAPTGDATQLTLWSMSRHLERLLDEIREIAR